MPRLFVFFTFYWLNQQKSSVSWFHQELLVQDQGVSRVSSFFGLGGRSYSYASSLLLTQSLVFFGWQISTFRFTWYSPRVCACVQISSFIELRDPSHSSVTLTLTNQRLKGLFINRSEVLGVSQGFNRYMFSSGGKRNLTHESRGRLKTDTT